MQIYLDMDGVLMDYDRHILKWDCYWRGPLYHHKPESEWTPEQATNDKLYQDAMADPAFWTTMEPMQDAYVLWNFCRPYHPHVLTATPLSGAAYRDRCVEDKLGRIHQLFDGNFPVEDFHACLRHEKKAFATPGHILVDDMAPNCDEWTRCGGTAILHKNALHTIRILQEFIHG
jgi:hypothetical protein